MKKFLLSFFLIIASAGYVVQQYMGGATANAAASLATNQQAPQQTTQILPPTIPIPQPTPIPTPRPVAPPPPPAPIPTPPIAPPAPVKPKGLYVDGTYTGTAADAYYGNIQVQATIHDGKLTDVTFLQYPNDRRTSQHINDQAMPYLKSEAIQAQSANVSGVSGATDSSQAFVESLGNALAQAKNS